MKIHFGKGGGRTPDLSVRESMKPPVNYMSGRRNNTNIWSTFGPTRRSTDIQVPVLKQQKSLATVLDLKSTILIQASKWKEKKKNSRKLTTHATTKKLKIVKLKDKIGDDTKSYMQLKNNLYSPQVLPEGFNPEQLSSLPDSVVHHSEGEDLANGNYKTEKKKGTTNES